MSMFPNTNTLDYGYAETGERSRLLSQFFNQVYLWMAVGLMWTAVVSAAFAYVPALQPFATRPLMITAMLAAFFVSIATQAAAIRLSLGAGIALFLLYASLIGFAIAPIWLVYAQSTIGIAFLLTGGIFAVMSLIGFVTKMDLTKVGAIMIAIAFGLFIASIVNLFFASSFISWLVTYAVVIVFPVIVAYETQKLRNFALAYGENGNLASRVALIGALILYISFINIFLSILRILGDRR